MKELTNEELNRAPGIIQFIYLISKTIQVYLPTHVIIQMIILTIISYYVLIFKIKK